MRYSGRQKTELEMRGVSGYLDLPDGPVPLWPLLAAAPRQGRGGWDGPTGCGPTALSAGAEMALPRRPDIVATGCINSNCCSTLVSLLPYRYLESATCETGRPSPSPRPARISTSCLTLALEVRIAHNCLTPFRSLC